MNCHQPLCHNQPFQRAGIKSSLAHNLHTEFALSSVSSKHTEILEKVLGFFAIFPLLPVLYPRLLKSARLGMASCPLKVHTHSFYQTVVRRFYAPRRNDGTGGVVPQGFHAVASAACLLPVRAVGARAAELGDCNAPVLIAPQRQLSQ